jgi:hypothetical protein
MSIIVEAVKPKIVNIATKFCDIWGSSYISVIELSILRKQFDITSSTDSFINRNIKKSIELEVIIS